ncbi:MAG: hypothetical protein GVY22_07375 [Gammaproteobacteria bacterium]|nr:hypothetical protein [Gammaproteobacteria bacterium]
MPPPDSRSTPAACPPDRCAGLVGSVTTWRNTLSSISNSTASGSTWQ